MEVNNSNTRITSIDFLRAVALLGIIFVHFRNGFGHDYSPNVICHIDWISHQLIGKLLAHRCATIFNILFGVSFYLILRKPDYPAKKFVFRCFLLLLIGFVNKIFYSYDVLMWYGICGMILAPFRKVSTKRLPFVIILLMALRFISEYAITDYINIPDFSNRYNNTNIIYIVTSLHLGVRDYFIYIIKQGIFGTLAYFLIGYYIGQRGWLNRLNEITLCHILVSIIISLLLFINKNDNLVTQNLFVLSGAFCYSFIMMWLYYHTPLRRIFDFFCSYGKLGLTNYTSQGIIGVVAFNAFNIEKWPFSYITLLAIAIYMMQSIISYYWLKVYKFGPMEWVWRCLTNKQFTSMKIKNS